MRVFITGDKHGDFRSIEHFVKIYDTKLEDYLIILGDAGVNYYNNTEDYYRKKKLSELPINIIFIHGNHEMRPQNIPTYKWHLIENELGGVFSSLHTEVSFGWVESVSLYAMVHIPLINFFVWI